MVGLRIHEVIFNALVIQVLDWFVFQINILKLIAGPEFMFQNAPCFEVPHPCTHDRLALLHLHQLKIDDFTKSLGSERPAFDIIIATGARSSMPHCQTNRTLVKNDEVLLVDMGVVFEGYHSDLTRPVFLGKMSPLQKKIYRTVWDAQRLGIQKAGPGVPASEVDAACRRSIEKSGYGRYFGHGTGHGVGLEIHEAPSVSSRSKTILQPGMVITVEPGIYLPGKFGVRIEDMVLITNKGNEVLTRDLDQPI